MAQQFRFASYGWLILLAVLVAAGTFYLYDRFSNSRIDPFEAIPENAGLFIKINEPGALLRGLSGKNEIWDDLLSTEPLGTVLSSFEDADSILNSLGYTEMLDNGNIFLALAEDSAQMALCILFEWPYGASESDIDNFLAELSGRDLDKTAMSFRDISGYSLSDSTGSFCYYCIDHGLCMIGSTPGILENCAKRIDEKSSLPFTALYDRVSSTSGQNVDANIYINFHRLPELTKNIFASSYYKERQILPEFGSWSEIDLLIKSDEILLNGYTETVDTLNQFLSLFKRQKPQKVEITRILPYNTSMLISLGFNDFKKLYEDNVAYLKNEGVYPERDHKLTKLVNRFGPDLEDHMISWIGNELALAMINPHLDDQASEAAHEKRPI